MYEKEAPEVQIQMEYLHLGFSISLVRSISTLGTSNQLFFNLSGVLLTKSWMLYIMRAIAI